MSVASLAGYLNNGGGGGGNVNGIIQGAGINVIDEGNGEYKIENDGVISTTNGVGISAVLSIDTGNLTITNTGVTSIIDGAGININNATGAVTISSTVNPDDYVTQTDASTTYQTKDGMTDYLTTTTADATFQTLTGMADYLTTATAGTTYQTQAAMTNYLTTATANTTYQPIGMIGSGKSTLTVSNGVNPNQEFNTQVEIKNFIGTEDTVYVISINAIDGYNTNPWTVVCKFLSTDNVNTLVSVSFLYIGTSQYDGGDFNLPYSVIAMN